MKSLYLVLLLVFNCVLVSAQQPSQQSDVIRTNTELVQTAVTVLDKKGNFVDRLQRDQFQLVVDGKPREIAFFERIAAGSTRERELAASGIGVNTKAPVPPANGLVVTSSMEIAGTGLTFGDGGKPATVRLAGVVLNDKGKIAASFRNQLNINPAKAGLADAGIFYNHHTPLTPGIYQFRVAVRDEKSGRVGSAMQWIVIPDLARNQLTLSSLLLGGQVVEDRANTTTSPQVQLSVDHSFPRSSPLGYWIFVYNAKRDAGGNPQLTVQTHVLRDGQAVLSSPQRRLNNGGPDPQRIPFGEELALRTLSPGRYDLKVTITDGLAGTTASQVANFIVR